MLPWPCHMLPFLEGLKVGWFATKFERRDRTEPNDFYYVWVHYQEFFFVLPKEQRRLFVVTPMSQKEWKPCRAPTVPSSLAFAYKANATVDID